MALFRHNPASESTNTAGRGRRRDTALSVVPPTSLLVEAKERLDLLAQHAGVGLWDIHLHEADPMDPRNQCIWSPAFRSLLGFRDEAEFPDGLRTWKANLHPDDVAGAIKALQASLGDRTGSTPYDDKYRVKTKDGSYKWFRAVGGVTRDAAGTPIRACGSLIDIETAQEIGERLELLSQYAGVGLWSLEIVNGDPMHPRSRCVWSAEFRRLAGYQHESEFPNDIRSWSDHLHPDDAAHAVKALQASLDDRTGRTAYDDLYRLKSKTGTYRWFRAVGGVARDSAGTAVRACGSLIDIDDEKTADAERQGALQDLAARFEATVMSAVDVVSSSAADIQGLAKEMTRSADQAGEQASTVTTAATHATTNVESVAATAEELSASVIDISGRVAEAARISTKAAEENARTNGIVQQLASAADHIGEVVDVIKSIADQTNLLALNAAIEAAHVGDAGKGFAVVAHEVKNLATQTAKATVDIRQQIQTLQGETHAAVGAIQTIGQVIDELQGICVNIAAASEEQSASTEEIASTVHAAADDTHKVSQNIEAVAQAVTTTGTAAVQVLTSADALEANAERLRAEVRSFLLTVRGG